MNGERVHKILQYILPVLLVVTAALLAQATNSETSSARECRAEALTICPAD